MFNLIYNLFLLLTDGNYHHFYHRIITTLFTANRKKVKKLIIINPPEKITFNNFVKLEIKGFDGDDKEIKVESVKWEVSGGETINSEGLFTAGSTKQKVTITASVDKVKTTTEIEIIEPQLKIFKLIAQRYIAKPNDNIKLDIQCQDQLNYPLKIDNITWSQNFDYTINYTGFLSFKSQAKGEYIIKATADKYNLSDSVKITIPSILTSVKINPQNLVIKPEQEYKFILKGLDQCGDNFPLKQVQWSCIKGGKINSETGIFLGNYQEKKATITAKVDNFSDSVVIDLLPVLYELKINCTNLRIEPNQKIQFQAIGYDQFGSQISLNNIEWNVDQGSIDNDGNYQGLSYETEVKITVKSDHLTSSTTLLIRKPSILTKLEIRPSYISILPSENHQFNLVGLDQRNERMPVYDQVWSCDEGEIDQSGYYSSYNTQQGYAQIQATVNNLTAIAEVYIPSVVKSIEIEPKIIELYPEQQCSFKVTGYDQQKQTIIVSGVKWKTQWGGSIDAIGIFIAGYQKPEVIVTARVDSLTATAKVIVLPVLRSLVIEPKSVALYPEDTQQFTVKGYDQFKQEIDAGIIYWESDGGNIDENGLYQAHYYDKGIYQITATSNHSPKYNRTTRNILFTAGVGMKILGWVMSPDSHILEIIQFLLNGENSPLLPEYESNQNSSNTNLLSNTSEQINLTSGDNLGIAEDSKATGNIINVDNVSGGDITLDNPFTDWIFEGIQKRVSKFFSSIGKFCLNQANKYVNAKAKVEVLPILRSITIIPNNPTIIYGNTIKLNVMGFDQHNESSLLNSQFVEWETTAGEISQDGILSLEESEENEQLKSIFVIARVDEFKSCVEVSVKPLTLSITPKPVIILKPLPQNYLKEEDTGNFDDLGNDLENDTEYYDWLDNDFFEDYLLLLNYFEARQVCKILLDDIEDKKFFQDDCASYCEYKKFHLDQMD